MTTSTGPQLPPPAHGGAIEDTAAGLAALCRELSLEWQARARADFADRQEHAMVARAGRTQQVLLRWLEQHGYFDGQNITAYLREFELALRVLNLTDRERRQAFCHIVQPYFEDRVLDVSDDSVDWSQFVANLRSAFAAQDRTRLMPVAFVEWIKSPKEGPLEAILAEFERKYDELDAQEQAALANQGRLFVRALSRELRLSFAEPLYDRFGNLCATWDEVRR